jgi:hypothetical protein
MEDPTRGMLGSAPPDAPSDASNAASDAPKAEVPSPSGLPAQPEPARPSRDPRFIGNAMRSLYQSSDSSVERGDATRVIRRSQPDLPAAPAPSSSQKPPAQPFSSAPPGPRVDVTLWVVLALGLFAIAGVMLSAAL